LPRSGWPSGKRGVGPALGAGASFPVWARAGIVARHKAPTKAAALAQAPKEFRMWTILYSKSAGYLVHDFTDTFVYLAHAQVGTGFSLTVERSSTEDLNTFVSL